MKTQLDLYKSATDAAATTLDMVTSFEVESAAFEVFKAEKQDPADWDLWKRQFDCWRQTALALRLAKAPSTVAAEEAARKN